MIAYCLDGDIAIEEYGCGDRFGSEATTGLWLAGVGGWLIFGVLSLSLLNSYKPKIPRNQYIRSIETKSMASCVT